MSRRKPKPLEVAKKLGICEICGKILSMYNKSQKLCYFHQLPEKYQESLVNKAHGGNLCSSPVNFGVVITSLDYEGTYRE